MKIKYLHGLTYPKGVLKVQKPVASSFDKKLTLHKSLKELETELGRFGVKEVIFTSDVHLTGTGVPYPLGAVKSHQPTQTGVSIFFTKYGQRRGLSFDKYDMVQHNVRALVKTIDAFRGIERWGGQEAILNIMNHGLPDAAPNALALPDMRERPWYGVLEVEQDADEEAIKAAFRKLSKQYHPDKETGSEELFKIIKDARDKGLGQLQM